MVITDRGVQYKVCDECGGRFDYDSPDILTGVANMMPDLTLDICTCCCETQKVDVCHGSCLRWHYKSALNEAGECRECAAAREVAHG